MIEKGRELNWELYAAIKREKQKIQAEKAEKAAERLRKEKEKAEAEAKKEAEAEAKKEADAKKEAEAKKEEDAKKEEEAKKVISPNIRRPVQHTPRKTGTEDEFTNLSAKNENARNQQVLDAIWEVEEDARDTWRARVKRLKEESEAVSEIEDKDVNLNDVDVGLDLGILPRTKPTYKAPHPPPKPSGPRFSRPLRPSHPLTPTVPATQAPSIFKWNYIVHFNILLQAIKRIRPYLIAKSEAIISQLQIIENNSKLDDLKISLRQKSSQLLANITEFNSSYTSLNTFYNNNEPLLEKQAPGWRLHYKILTTLQTNILRCITDDSEINLYNTHNIDSSNYTHYKRYDKLKYTVLITDTNKDKNDINLNSSKIYNAIMKNKEYTYFKISTQPIDFEEKLYTDTTSLICQTWNKIFIKKIGNTLYKLPINFELPDKHVFNTTHYKPDEKGETINDEHVEVVEVYPVLITVSGASLNYEYPKTVILEGFAGLRGGIRSGDVMDIESWSERCDEALKRGDDGMPSPLRMPPLNKSKTPKKEILGKIRCIYKVPGSRKEHVKHNGQLISVSDYKKLMKQR
tara:strand:- start:206 stop:1927 length:1722 start_codon:yes stop_codon:yes gene_type:complete